jgi:hypothetical protein
MPESSTQVEKAKDVTKRNYTTYDDIYSGKGPDDLNKRYEEFKKLQYEQNGGKKEDLIVINDVSAPNAETGNGPRNIMDNSPNTRLSIKGVGTYADLQIGDEKEPRKKVKAIYLSWYKGKQRTNRYELEDDTGAIILKGESSRTGSEVVKLPREVETSRIRIRFMGNTSNNWFSLLSARVFATDTPKITNDIDPDLTEEQDTGQPTGGTGGEDKTLPAQLTHPFVNEMDRGATVFNWSLSDNPNADPQFRIDAGSKAVTKREGAITYHTIQAREGGLKSGGKQDTARLHYRPKSINDKKVGTWKEAKNRGWLTDERMPKDFIQEGYFRVRDPRDGREAKARITDKYRGGPHSDNQESSAACVGFMLNIGDPKKKDIFERELDHPDYVFLDADKSFQMPTLENCLNKWIGKIVYTRVNKDGSTVNRMYVNQDPIDTATGRIKYENYRLYAEYSDSGKDGKYAPTIPNWSGDVNTWRINELGEIDFFGLSVRALLPQQ